MSNRSIFDFLGEAKGDQALTDALEGKSSNGGGFDGPPLDVTRQYRATIVRGEWRQSQAGNYSFSFTFQVDEPDEWAGRKFSEYYSPDSGAHQVSKEKFAQLIGASGVSADDIVRTGDVHTDNGNFAKLFEGTTYVIATRVWGDDDDKTGIRYLNKDYGQALKDKIDPPKAKAPGGKSGGGNLKADITVPKNQPADEEAQAPAQPASLPGGKSPTGIQLPVGLQR